MVINYFAMAGLRESHGSSHMSVTNFPSKLLHLCGLNPFYNQRATLIQLMCISFTHVRSFLNNFVFVMDTFFMIFNTVYSSIFHSLCRTIIFAAQFPKVSKMECLTILTVYTSKIHGFNFSDKSVIRWISEGVREYRDVNNILQRHLFLLFGHDIVVECWHHKKIFKGSEKRKRIARLYVNKDERVRSSMSPTGDNTSIGSK